MTRASSFAGVILAAGDSSRMGKDKALLPWPPVVAGLAPSSQTFLSAAIRSLLIVCDFVVVVVGRNEGALATIIYSEGASLAVNPDPARGQFSSLQVGLREVLNRGRDAAMVTLVDRPPVAAATLRFLHRAYETSTPQTWAVVPSFAGNHGHPYLAGREMIEAFLRVPSSSTAREVERAHQGHIEYVSVDDPFVAMNINTPEDYAALPTTESRGFSPAAGRFLDSVTRLKPRVAAFDCDGTLWSGDLGERFFDWTLGEDGIVASILGRGIGRGEMRDRYAAYKRGEIGESAMCGEMTTMYRGTSEEALLEAAGRYFEQFFLHQIFPEMRELIRRLQESGCEIWAVSSSNEWVIRAAMKYFGIPASHILAAKVELDGGFASDRLIRVPSGAGKPQALREVAKKEIDAAFGNSRWDAEMLSMARHAFAINPNPDLEALARKNGWPIYFPQGILPGNDPVEKS
jgi:CTP:molybdopterin cytidylyltransferase MocA/phosphoserine phosphatase